MVRVIVYTSDIQLIVYQMYIFLEINAAMLLQVFYFLAELISTGSLLALRGPYDFIF